MIRRNDTRERVLRTAAGLFQRQGYNATGLNQVLAESRAPKGSLYFHFPDGKEQLAAEAVAVAGGELGERIAAAVAAAPGPAEAVARIGDLLAHNLEESGFQEGCPVATVALEAAGDSEPIRSACDEAYASWLGGLADCLHGHGVDEAEAEALADLVLSSLQGALLLARVRRDTAVIHSVARRIGGMVAGAAG
ncbi:transcriptional regulator, TetR family [Microbispora rosea]|uniref:Transcriptional regulator, TetR family n=1 Tax=Microbispora rosea TaxID=58117 RepID=A0A1N6XAM9_9ACTN|nr:TetR/AcrR family transcriptional regulator [Microbispora rosea]GIH52759.1 TetR family transcriptional regulator [Microbispora rosea subsp. rosea]SIQ99320.1 transcriptional regulator, TetR family [Microbispora rosea]